MNGQNSDVALQALKQNIQKLNALINQLENIQQQIGTAKDSPDLRKKVLSIQSTAKTIIETSQQNLKELNNFRFNADVKIQKERFTDELFKLVKKFQTTSQSILAKEKEAEINKPNRVDYENYYGETFPPVRFSKEETAEVSALKQAQMQNKSLEEVQERKKQFDQLESDIQDLNSMFKDLAVMVHDQGQDIDAIEKNIESSGMAVQSANTQLVEATQYQSKARRKKLIIIAIIILIILIIIAVIVLSLKPWNW